MDDSWDPMMADFIDPEFNRYDKGDARHLPSNLSSGERNKLRLLGMDCTQKFRLFVSGLPVQLDENGLYNIFQTAGKPEVHIPQIKEKGLSSDKRYGFVTFSTITESEEAISKFNGHTIKHKNELYRLRVEYTKQDNNKPYFNNQSNAAGPHSTYNGRSPHNDTSSGAASQPMNSAIQAVPPGQGSGRGQNYARLVQEPQPGFNIPPDGATPKAIFGRGMPPGLLGDRPEGYPVNVQSSQPQPLVQNGAVNYGPPPNQESNGTSPRDQYNGASPRAAGSDIKSCSKCGLASAALKACNGCKEAKYCNRDCQRSDWQEHKIQCKKRQRSNINSDDFDPFSVNTEAVMASLTSMGLEKEGLIMAATVPIEVLEKGNSQVTISSYVSPSDFFINLTGSAGMLSNMMELLQKACEGIRGYRPIEGEFCAALYSDDNTWYRAVVVDEYAGNRYNVAYVDYGNQETVPGSRLSKIPPGLATLPIQGIQCSLAGVEPLEGGQWSEEAIQTVKRFMGGAVNYYVELIETVKPIHKVTVKDSNGNCCSTILLEENLCRGSPGKCVAAGFPAQDVMQRVGTTCKIIVTHVDSPHCFWGSPFETLDVMQTITTELQECESMGPGTENLKPGDRVAVKWEDGCWYRGLIQDQGQTVYTVFMVDYGNVAKIEKKNAHLLSAPLKNRPRMALQMRMDGIYPVQNNWSTEAITEFRDKATQSITDFDILKENGEELLVRNQEISTFMATLSHYVTLNPPELETPALSPPCDQHVQDNALSPKADHSFKSPPLSRKVTPSHIPRISDLQYPVLPVSDDLVQCVSLGNTTLDEITLVHPPSLKSLEEKFLPEFNAYYEHTSGPYHPTASEVVSAKSSTDGCFYRGGVLSIDGKLAEILFVEYRNVEKVPFSDIRKLKREHAETILPVVQCKLHGITGTTDQGLYDEEANQALIPFFDNKMVFIRVKSVSCGIHRVDLFNEDKVLLNDLLLQTHLAVKFTARPGTMEPVSLIPAHPKGRGSPPQTHRSPPSHAQVVQSPRPKTGPQASSGLNGATNKVVKSTSPKSNLGAASKPVKKMPVQFSPTTPAPKTRTSSLSPGSPGTILDRSHLRREDLKIGDSYDVVPMFTEGPDRFFCILCEKWPEKTELTKTIHEECFSSMKAFRNLPEVGHLCLAYCGEFNEWCRGAIKIKGNVNTSVVYLDYGNMDNLPLEKLRPIDSKHLDLPICTFDLKLSGAENLHQDVVDYFKKALMSQPIKKYKIEVVKECAKSFAHQSYEVHLFDDNIDVAKLLLEKNAKLVLAVHTARPDQAARIPPPVAPEKTKAEKIQELEAKVIELEQKLAGRK